MKIAIGADHRGYDLKSRLKQFLEKTGNQVLDFGTNSEKPCDYPSIGFDVARSVAKGESDRGILICMSGIGMSIVANKVPGVRAAICDTKTDAELSREHNDANVIIISAKYIKDKPEDVLEKWFSANISEERHKRRVDQIREIEQKILKGEIR